MYKHIYIYMYSQDVVPLHIYIHRTLILYSLYTDMYKIIVFRIGNQ